MIQLKQLKQLKQTKMMMSRIHMRSRNLLVRCNHDLTSVYDQHNRMFYLYNIGNYKNRTYYLYGETTDLMYTDLYLRMNVPVHKLVYYTPIEHHHDGINDFAKYVEMNRDILPLYSCEDWETFVCTEDVIDKIIEEAKKIYKIYEYD